LFFWWRNLATIGKRKRAGLLVPLMVLGGQRARRVPIPSAPIFAVDGIEIA
jgi:hypothetical protein